MRAGVFPDLDAVSGATGLSGMIGALMTVVLVLAVLIIVICAAVWAIAQGVGNWHAASRARAGLLVGLSAAAVAGALVAWTNFLVGVGSGV